MKKIAFFDTKPYDRISFENANGKSRYKIKYFEPHLTPDTVSLAEGYDAVCAFVNDKIDKDVIEALDKMDIHLLVMRCAGYNNVDLSAAYRKVHVLRVPAYSPYAVAEHALALIMTLNRKTHKAYYRTRESNFSIAGLTGMDLYGKIAGVIGTGKIGRIMIGILKGLGMKVLAFDLYPNEKAAEEFDFSYTDLEILEAKSDLITLHCPLTPETQHIINSDAIERMKEGVMIVNTGRGGLIDTKALIKGLKKKKIGSAGLDVYEEEGEFFFEDLSETGIPDDVLARLLSFPNVLVTSHQAFLTHEALGSIADTTITNLDSYFEESRLENEVCYRCDKENCHRTREGRCF